MLIGAGKIGPQHYTIFPIVYLDNCTLTEKSARREKKYSFIVLSTVVVLSFQLNHKVLVSVYTALLSFWPAGNTYAYYAVF